MALSDWLKTGRKGIGMSGLDDRQLRRRETMAKGMIALTVLVLLALIFAGWTYLQKIADFFEEELGRRLRSVATLTAKLMAADVQDELLDSAGLELAWSTQGFVLTRVHDENQLQGVYLVDEDYRTYASSRNLFPPGERLTFLLEDSLYFQQAVGGQPAVPPTQVLEGNRFKSAYAPVMVLNQVEAVVVVQASADFFDLLSFFQRGLILGGAISITLAVLFSVFLYWAIRILTRTQESLRRSERLAAMGQMAATVAHEIRNPLGIIKSTADVLQSRYNNNAEPDELFEFIPSEVRRLNRLVSDFLTFARDRALEPNASDLQATVVKTLESLDDELRESKVILSTHYEQTGEVRHDEDGVGQVLLNLTLNAIQAMNGGGDLTIDITRRAQRGKTWAAVQIKDTGCGFDARTAQIFEPFYTTKTSGSGLGLAICKQIVEKHGGWIEAESKVGEGTTMRFYLPAIQHLHE